VSDGCGSTRCWLAGDQMRMLVADYVNAGAGAFVVEQIVPHRKPREDLCSATAITMWGMWFQRHACPALTSIAILSCLWQPAATAASLCPE
jgi:hypothetical protein